MPGASVRNQRYGFTGLYAVEHRVKIAVFVVLMVTGHRRGNAEMSHQHGRRAGVLCQYKRGLLQHPYGARRHISHIPHRRGHYAELAFHILMQAYEPSISP